MLRGILKPTQRHDMLKYKGFENKLLGSSESLTIDVLRVVD